MFMGLLRGLITIGSELLYEADDDINESASKYVISPLFVNSDSYGCEQGIDTEELDQDKSSTKKAG